MKTKITVLAACLLFTLHLPGQSISFTYDNDGNMESRYVSVLRSSESQSEEETSEVVSVSLGEQEITVYPNPTRGEICIEIIPLHSGENNRLLLFDSSGRLLETKPIESERTYIEISGSPGFYLLDIHMGDNTSKWKIIKQ